MASTVFQDYNQNNPIVSAWLNDVNGNTYSPSGAKKVASQSAAAWVRFSITGGVVTIQQSVNIATVTRTAQGVYQITYAAPLTNVTNSYSLNMSQAGFISYGAESANSIVVNTTNTTNAAFDPGSVSVQIFGVN